jgi:regulator of sigma E protease
VTDFLLFVVVLGTLILGHELGHFLVAKWRGVKIEEFGIGFPPRLATLFTAGDTEYTLNWIPFGGFVRPAGENDPEVPNGLAASSKLTRTLVLFAGPAANIILAFVAFLFAFKFAAPDVDRVLITDVVQGSPAQAAGIQPGDIVEEAGNVEVDSFESLQTVIGDSLGKPLGLLLSRDGELIDIQLVPRVDFPEGQGPIGVTLGFPPDNLGWIQSAGFSLESIRTQVMAILQLPGRIMSGAATEQETRVAGLKGIHDMIAWASDIDQSAQRPFFTLNIVGVISVGLAIANMLPIPALDGGRLLFVLIEAIIGHRISPRLEGLAHAIGFLLLLMLMVYFNLQDFLNPIELP